MISMHVRGWRTLCAPAAQRERRRAGEKTNDPEVEPRACHDAILGRKGGQRITRSKRTGSGTSNV